MRRKRSGGLSAEGSFDSFLSTVTKNGLGMLVLVAMASTFSSQLTLGQGKFKRSLGTPLVKRAPAGLQPVYFECRGGRVNPLEFGTIATEEREFFLALGARRDELAREYNARKLSNEYYTFEFQTRCGDEPFPDAPAVEFRPHGKTLGDTLDDVKNPAGRFRKRLRTLDPARHALILFVRRDSFEFFRGLREILQKEGFPMGWHPFDRPVKIRQGGGGGFEID